MSTMTAARSCFKLPFRQNCNQCFAATSRLPNLGSTSSFPYMHSDAVRKSGCFSFFTTDASPDNERVTDEVLNEFLATIEKTPTSLEVYHAYIYRMCKAGNLSVAGQMLQILDDKNISFTPNVYNRILVEASQKNDINFACQVFKKLLFSCGTLSAASYLNFAKAFTKTDDCAVLLRFVKEALEMTSPSTVVLNRILYAFAKSGQKDKALLIFDHFKRQNFNLDLITYNIVLDILGRGGCLDEMLHEFASMKEAGVVPDTISYNTLINSLRKVGRSDKCVKYFKEMHQNGIKPDILTYTALIESFGRSGNVEESLNYFREMKLKGIRPSIHNYRSLINNLRKSGKDELASELSEELHSSSTCLAGPKDFKQKRRR